MELNRTILLQEAKKILEFQHMLGVENYPATGSFLAFLRPTTFPSQQKKQEETPETRPPSTNIQDVLESMVDCTRCLLHRKRRNIVTGAGPSSPLLMIIGDWPSQADDQSGEPFSDPEGEMLNNMLKAIHLSREETYITTLVKCHPPQNRPPTQEEITTCLPYLYQQIAAVSPKVLCAMGPLATQTLLQTDQRLVQLRGRFHSCRSIPLMPTFHPTFLLKNPEMKKATWADLIMIMKKLKK